MESRWLRWIGTGVIAIVAVGSVASTAAGAGQRAWKANPCTEEAGVRGKAARSTASIALSDVRLQPWFRLDPRLDREGALQGQRLAVGLDGAQSSRILDLPAESFAAGPFGGIVLLGFDDGTSSHLEALAVAGECSWSLGEEADVIRRATVDDSGTTIYEVRVDRATRADLGIWARPVDRSSPAVRILDPIEADERFGQTWSTEFAWDVSGGRLAIQSCGEAACRTRVYDPVDGAWQLVAEADLGTMVGLSGDALVTYEACPGLPCPVVAESLGTGVRQVLADAAAVAILAATPDGPRLVHEVLEHAGITVKAVRLDGSGSVDLGPVGEGQRLYGPPSLAQAGTTVPSGWVLLGPDGRLPDGGPDSRTQLRRVPDGFTVQLDEVS